MKLGYSPFQMKIKYLSAALYLGIFRPEKLKIICFVGLMSITAGF